jgi:hypothetical protein
MRNDWILPQNKKDFNLQLSITRKFLFTVNTTNILHVYLYCYYMFRSRETIIRYTHEITQKSFRFYSTSKDLFWRTLKCLITPDIIILQ